MPTVQAFEIIAAGQPNSAFDRWVDVLRRAGIEGTQIPIADYDRQNGNNQTPHTRGNEVYVLVPSGQLEDALNILKNDPSSGLLTFR
jgi:hypothetical protein